MDREQINLFIDSYEPDEYKWVDPKTFILGQWVRMKCIYGCPSYGKRACCPPNVPPLAECERFFSEYSQAVIVKYEVKLDDPKKRHAWTAKRNTRLAKLERDVFLAGYHKSFVLFIDSCHLCKDCSPDHLDCQNPMLSRPTPEALGVDVYGTVRKHGFTLEVRSDYNQTMRRYGVLLVE